MAKVSSRKEIVTIALFQFALFALLILQFYKIQVVEGDKWSKEADQQHQRVVKEPFHRGIFFSNTAIKEGQPEILQPFVIDVQKFHLFIDPIMIPPDLKSNIAAQICALLGPLSVPYDEMRAEFERKTRSRRVAKWLSVETRQLIGDWWEKYASKEKIPRNALFFISDYQRSYPFGSLLGQVLHTIRDDKEEKTNQGVPTGGLELYFNEYLKGKEGKRLLMHSPRNPLEMGKVIDPPQNGAQIYLTINHYLQAITEEELAKGVQQTKGKAGWAVMMDPFNGHILALAHYPFFDPSHYADYFNDAKLTEATRLKSITDAPEIGSSMKPLTLAIALKANKELEKEGKQPIFSPIEKIPTTARTFPGRKILRDLHHHSFLNMYLGLQRSSNVYMATLVDRIIKTLGNDWYRHMLEEFGFGIKTEVELPGEVSGVLPRPGKLHANGKLEWSLPTPYSLAMGHNIQATSLQMMRAYAIFANGGKLVAPTLIKKIVRVKENGEEEVLLDHTGLERVLAFPRVLEQEIVSEVVRAMKYCTKQGGSGVKADIRGFTEAGKTSSAEKIVDGAYSKKLNTSSFIGFAPVNNPRFVLIVSIDEPEAVYIQGLGKMSLGGQCAAPIFREIGTRTLEYLGVTPDDPHGYPVGDPRYDREKADWVVENSLLQELYQLWNN